MSVQLNHYAVIGILFPYGGADVQMAKHFGIENPDKDGDDIHDVTEEYHDSAYDDKTGHNGVIILSDGMGGKFQFIGRVLKKTANYEGFGKPIEFPVLTDILKQEIAADIKRELGVEGEIKQYVISHYR